MTVKQIAEKTGLSPGYIRSALIAKSLKGEKEGRDWFVKEGELTAWLSREHKRPGRPAGSRPRTPRTPAAPPPAEGD